MSMDFTLLDGGMGRELERIDAPFRQPEWSALALMESPEHVLRAHQNFIDAGADIITTNAYAVVPFHIGEERFKRDGFSLARLSAKLAFDAAESAGRDVKIAGCLPPLFGSYRPDLFDESKAPDYLKTLIEAQEPYVDFWLGETLSSLEEAEAVADALKGNSKNLWLSFNLKEKMKTGEPALIRSLETMPELLDFTMQAGADALLLNCNTPEDTIIALEEIINLKPDIKLGAYANTFAPVREAVAANEGLNAARDDLIPNCYTSLAKKWIEMDVSIVGGCCGIGPEHIADIHRLRVG